MQGFKRIRTRQQLGTDLVDLAFDQVETAMRALQANDLFAKGALLIEDVSLSTTAMEIVHGLERKPFVMVIRQNTGAVIYTGAATVDEKKSINLVATAAVVASVVLF